MNRFKARKTNPEKDLIESGGHLEIDLEAIADASVAAVEDARSGAYDEFIFTDHGFKDMPFERYLQRYLKLSSERIVNEAKSRTTTTIQNIAKINIRIEKLKIKIALRQSRIEKTKEQKDFQVAVLNGEIAGKHQLNWKDTIPTRGSEFVEAFHLATPFLTYLIVGIVDLGIIYVSFNKIPGIQGWDAIVFTVPAVAAQVIIPHFIGQRLQWIYKSHRARRANVTEIVALTFVWLLFVTTMMYIRLAYMLPGIRAGIRANKFPIEEPIIYLMNLLMLVALGAWLIFTESRSNPHIFAFRKLDFQETRALKKISKLESKLSALEVELLAEKSIADVVEETSVTAGEISSQQLFSAVRESYRRSLVNQFGNVDFTSKYLEKEYGVKND